MDRIESFNDIFKSGEKEHKHVSLVSELEPRKVYKILSNGPYVYDGQEEGDYVFHDSVNSIKRVIPAKEMKQLIDSYSVAVHEGEPEPEPTVPEYKYLDRFTRNSFLAETRDLWERHGIRGQFTSSQLMELDDLCRNFGIEDMPASGDPHHAELVSHPKWTLFKRYVRALAPDSEFLETVA